MNRAGIASLVPAEDEVLRVRLVHEEGADRKPAGEAVWVDLELNAHHLWRVVVLDELAKHRDKSLRVLLEGVDDRSLELTLRPRVASSIYRSRVERRGRQHARPGAALESNLPAPSPSGKR